MGSLAGDTRTTLMARPLWQVGLAAMIVAGVVAEVFGLLARAIDVPIEAPAMGGDEAEKIFVGGLVVATFFYGVIGILVAMGLARWASNPARAWLVIAPVGTALSLLAPITAEDTETATKVVLALSHLLVAAIMIPLIAQRLAMLEADRPEAAENARRLITVDSGTVHVRSARQSPTVASSASVEYICSTSSAPWSHVLNDSTRGHSVAVDIERSRDWPRGAELPDLERT